MASRLYSRFVPNLAATIAMVVGGGDLFAQQPDLPYDWVQFPDFVDRHFGRRALRDRRE